MTRRTFTLGALISAIFSAGQISSADAAWTYEKTDGNALHFKDPADGGKGQKLKTALKNPEFHGLVSNPENGQTYVIYGGQSCDHCGDQRALYMTRIDGAGAPFQFVYPGQVRDPKRGVVFESRAFYGRCLPQVKAGYVSHQAEVVDRRRGMQKSVLIAEPGKEKVEDRLIESRLPALRTTLDLVKRKECFEIAGRSRSVLKKNLGPGVPRSVVEDEDEDEDENPDDKKDPVTPTTPDEPQTAPASPST